ncbi:hypothetical protein BCR34DRAFT_574498 [Clohesyomyces aquaticus]|uniref:Uncharacterized protein n=1 Tax=Clohesyomyces aquaticus TaxID=1231657 RepID=A0A1Y1YVK9_9PLEO|nr:hypothetical protein BCR34DRAFT_574498 [Clohesyomyces aquaticus]
MSYAAGSALAQVIHSPPPRSVKLQNLHLPLPLPSQINPLTRQTPHTQETRYSKNHPNPSNDRNPRAPNETHPHHLDFDTLSIPHTHPLHHHPPLSLSKILLHLRHLD